MKFNLHAWRGRAHILAVMLLGFAAVSFLIACNGPQKKAGEDPAASSDGSARSSAEQDKVKGTKAAETKDDGRSDANRDSGRQSDNRSTDARKAADDRAKAASESGKDGRSDSRKGADTAAGKSDPTKPTGRDGAAAAKDPTSDPAQRRSDGTDPAHSTKGDGGSAGKANNGGRSNDDVNPDVRGKDKRALEILPEDKNDGYVSESTYQVFITVFARNESEAVKAGRVEAARKTMNLILTSDQGPRRMSEEGRRELKRFIEANGEVVKILQESGESWSVVFRVKKDGLREHVRRMK